MSLCWATSLNFQRHSQESPRQILKVRSKMLRGSATDASWPGLQTIISSRPTRCLSIPSTFFIGHSSSSGPLCLPTSRSGQSPIHVGSQQRYSSDIFWNMSRTNGPAWFHGSSSFWTPPPGCSRGVDPHSPFGAATVSHPTLPRWSRWICHIHQSFRSKPSPRPSLLPPLLMLRLGLPKAASMSTERFRRIVRQSIPWMRWTFRLMKEMEVVMGSRRHRNSSLVSLSSHTCSSLSSNVLF